VSTGLRSGQVAAAARVNVQTLRYYERRGLLAEPARTLGGHRLYPAEAVTVLRVIKAAQRLGFTLDEVAELIEAGQHRHRGQSGGLQARAAHKLVEVEAKIADLTVIRQALRAGLAAGCDDLTTCAGTTCCPLPFTELAEPGAPSWPGGVPAGDPWVRAVVATPDRSCEGVDDCAPRRSQSRH
jgi:MerR family mercuric resistance operon transcriptional regulator